MKYHKQDVIDASEKAEDESYEYYYEYTLYSFEDGDMTLVARSYKDTYDEVCFLKKIVLGKDTLLVKEDESSECVQKAIEILKHDEHKKVVRFLFEK